MKKLRKIVLWVVIIAIFGSVNSSITVFANEIEKVEENSSDQNIITRKLTPTPEEAFSVHTTSTLGNYIYKYDAAIGGSDVVIPDTIKGLKIQTISNNVFSNKGITSVYIPEGVVEISNNAFSNNSITELRLPETLKIIGTNAFYNNNISKVIIPDSVETIGNTAFANAGIVDLKLPDAIKTIQGGAFSRNKLKEVSIPDSVTKIETKAFQANLQLETVHLSSNLVTIEDYAFQQGKIKELYMGDKVETIGDSAFANNNLGSIVLPNTLTTIDRMAFAENALESLEIPNSVTTLGIDAFAGNNISSLEIGSGITTIPDSCFTRNKLTSINFPSNINQIDKEAFNLNLLLSIDLPDTITTLDANAFGTQKINTGLTRKDGQIVKRMSQLYDANQLQQIRNPNVSWGTFNGITNEVTLNRTISNGYDIINYYYHIENNTISSDTALNIRLLFDTTYDYQVVFKDTDDTVLKTEYVAYGQSATPPSDPTPPENMEFTKWDTEFNVVTSELTVTAVYEIKKYDVYFKDVDDSVFTKSKVEYGTLVTEPSKPTKSGYTFDGWYKDKQHQYDWDFATDVINGDTSIYAKWQTIPYTVAIQEDKEMILRVQKDGINSSNETNSFLPSIVMKQSTANMITDYSLLEWDAENIAGFENYSPVCKVDKLSGKIIGLKSGIAKVTVKLKVGYDPLDKATYDSIIIIVPGDIDKSGNLTAQDTVAVTKHLLGDPLEDVVMADNKEYLKELADMNGDGKITSADSVAIKRMLAQLEIPSN